MIKIQANNRENIQAGEHFPSRPREKCKLFTVCRYLSFTPQTPHLHPTIINIEQILMNLQEIQTFE